MDKIIPKTAIITGASSGLGAAFARTLAAMGCHCTLVARSTDKLRSLAKEMGGTPWPAVHTADLTQPDDLKAIAEMITTQRPELLVLNAGFGLPQPFAECNPQELTQMTRVHVDHVVQLLRAYLATSAQGGCPSMVIVVASVAAFTPAPMAALYTATKRFQVELVRALAIGHPHTCFQVLCPGLVDTDFHQRIGQLPLHRPSLLPWWNADDVVRHSFHKLGSRKLIVVPGLAYRLVLLLRASIPDPLYRAFMRRFSHFTPLGKGL